MGAGATRKKSEAPQSDDSSAVLGDVLQLAVTNLTQRCGVKLPSLAAGSGGGGSGGGGGKAKQGSAAFAAASSSTFLGFNSAVCVAALALASYRGSTGTARDAGCAAVLDALLSCLEKVLPCFWRVR